jgi:putative membrane protein
MNHRFNILLLFIFLVIYFFVWFVTLDRSIYLLETMPAIIGLVALLFFYKKFQFLNITYLAIFIGAIMLIIGGYYTYAQVPVFDYFFHHWDLNRNYYDRFGHFFQGYISAIIINEIILRKKIIANFFWSSFFVFTASVAISAIYELVEMFISFTFPDRADVYMSIQSDLFDAQYDILCALFGSLVFVLFFRKYLIKYLQTIK